MAQSMSAFSPCPGEIRRLVPATCRGELLQQKFAGVNYIQGQGRTPHSTRGNCLQDHHTKPHHHITSHPLTTPILALRTCSQSWTRMRPWRGLQQPAQSLNGSPVCNSSISTLLLSPSTTGMDSSSGPGLDNACAFPALAVRRNPFHDHPPEYLCSLVDAGSITSHRAEHSRTSSPQKSYIRFYSHQINCQNLEYGTATFGVEW